MSRSGILRRIPPSEKSIRTAIIGQSGGSTALPGAVPGTKRSGSDIGSHTQSTTASSKCATSGATSLHHVADSHNGINIVAIDPSFSSFLQTLPPILQGQCIQAGSPLQL